MPYYCCVPGCKESTRSGRNYFHSFPQNDSINSKWIQVVSLRHRAPSNWDKVCSFHFSESDYKAKNSDRPLCFQRRKLKEDAVPSLNLDGQTVDTANFHFSESDYKAPNSDRPLCFQRRKLKEVAVPSLNLDCQTVDTAKPKRQLTVSPLKPTCPQLHNGNSDTDSASETSMEMQNQPRKRTRFVKTDPLQSGSRYLCPYLPCQHLFTDVLALVDHVQDHEINEQSVSLRPIHVYRCPFCTEKLLCTDMKLLIRHAKICHRDAYKQESDIVPYCTLISHLRPFGKPWLADEVLRNSPVKPELPAITMKTEIDDEFIVTENDFERNEILNDPSVGIATTSMEQPTQSILRSFLTLQALPDSHQLPTSTAVGHCGSDTSRTALPDPHQLPTSPAVCHCGSDTFTSAPSASFLPPHEATTAALMSNISGSLQSPWNLRSRSPLLFVPITSHLKAEYLLGSSNDTGISTVPSLDTHQPLTSSIPVKMETTSPEDTGLCISRSFESDECLFDNGGMRENIGSSDSVPEQGTLSLSAGDETLLPITHLEPLHVCASAQHGETNPSPDNRISELQDSLILIGEDATERDWGCF